MSYILNPDGSPRHDPINVDPPSSSSSSPARRRSSNQLSDEKERKHPCRQCNFRFYSRGDLQKHINTVHLGIKNHVCSVCAARFAEKGNLTKHEKRHSGIREFECNYPNCPKTFVLRDGLARHQKSVHGISSSPSKHESSGSSSNHKSSSSKSKQQSSSRSRK